MHSGTNSSLPYPTQTFADRGPIGTYPRFTVPVVTQWLSPASSTGGDVGVGVEVALAALTFPPGDKAMKTAATIATARNSRVAERRMVISAP